MMEPISILNKTMELSECRDQWVLDEKHGCYMLEDILYTSAATTPKFQRLSIFVPKHLMNADGTFSEEAKKGSNHKVFRYHEGDVEQLVSKREGNNLIFYTDKFSTYAVVYEPYIVSKDSDSTSENKQDSWNESGQGYENENNGGIIAALVKSKANKDRGALDQVPKTGQNYRNSFMSVKVECIIRKKEWDADREDVEE